MPTERNSGDGQQEDGPEPFLDPGLMDVAAQIADGVTIDWNAVERDHPGTSEAVEGLKEMERLLRAQRPVRPSPPPLSPIGAWGHLQLIEGIARGSVGEVYRAYDPHLQIEVALKLFQEDLSPGRRSSLQRCLDEARQAVRIRHRNVVAIYGADVHDRRAGIWMELIRGKTLETILNENGAFDADEAARIGLQICSALAEVHAFGMAHGDVKTTNVMREEGGRVVLMDFSSASATDPNAVEDRVYGTPQTAAPERLRGDKATAATDIYSTGVLLFRLVTGRFPVEGRSYEHLAEKHSRGERTLVRELRPSIPTWFASVVDRAIEPEPSNRFASAVRMEHALADGLRRHFPSHHPPSPRLVVSMAATVLAFVVIDSLPPYGGDRSPARSERRSELQIEASLMRERPEGVAPLRSGDEIRPGDGVFLEVRSDEPVWTYVINRDQAGSVFVLHPLPGFDRPNPLAPLKSHRLPGQHKGVTVSWRVSSAGGDEEFILVAMRKYRADLEMAVNVLPHAIPPGEARLTEGLGPEATVTRGTAETAPSLHPEPPLSTTLPLALEAVLSGPRDPDIRVVRFHLKNPAS
ncbi:MAG TPA: serine/threonine-protein kinase [Candidatus Eisenbacteria bacterium]|nr:serine/threonine-protein kinase [Candidatus Eisenbacteria bacterium]